MHDDDEYDREHEPQEKNKNSKSVKKKVQSKAKPVPSRAPAPSLDEPAAAPTRPENRPHRPLPSYKDLMIPNNLLPLTVQGEGDSN